MTRAGSPCRRITFVPPESAWQSEKVLSSMEDLPSEAMLHQEFLDAGLRLPSRRQNGMKHGSALRHSIPVSAADSDWCDCRANRPTRTFVGSAGGSLSSYLSPLSRSIPNHPDSSRKATFGASGSGFGLEFKC